MGIALPSGFDRTLEGVSCNSCKLSTSARTDQKE